MERRSIVPRIARALFWAALLFAFVMATLPEPPAPPVAMTDKAQHMLAFGVLTMLLSLGWPRLSWWKAVAVMAAFGALIEIVQLIPALHRSSDIVDWWADMGAVAAILLIVALVRRLT